MNLVIVTNESFFYHTYTIASELRKYINLKVFIQSRQKTPEIVEWCSYFNAVYVERKRFRNPLNFFLDLKFINELRNLKMDLIWFDTMNIYQIIFAKVLLKKFLVTIHDVEIHPHTNDYIGFLSQKLTLKILRKHVCVASNSQALLFKKKFGLTPLVFMLPIIDYYSLVETKIIPSITKDTSIIRFFYFGTIKPYKGIELLIDAAKALEQKGSNCIISVYGKLYYDENLLTQKTANIKNFKLYNKFHDYRDIYGIYSENDVLILPYSQVTQSAPLLIAYNENVPVICSDLPGFREYVVNGKSGFIFNNTVKDLVIKILYIINYPEILIEMKNYINSEIRKRYSMQNLVNSYLNNLKFYAKQL